MVTAEPLCSAHGVARKGITQSLERSIILEWLQSAEKTCFSVSWGGGQTQTEGPRRPVQGLVMRAIAWAA